MKNIHFIIIVVLLAACKKEQQAPVFSHQVINQQNQPYSVTDIDGNIYTAVKIGTQIWTVQNLRTRHYRNGDSIPRVKTNAEWNSLNTGAFCNFDNNPANVVTYGRLYNWYAVTDPRCIAPKGWHVPSIEEWRILVDYLGGVEEAGGHLKEAGTTHWFSPNTSADNSSGFTALPNGYRYPWGEFLNLGNVGPIWSRSENETGHPWQIAMYSWLQSVNLDDNEDKREALAVRLVKD